MKLSWIILVSLCMYWVDYCPKNGAFITDSTVCYLNNCSDGLPLFEMYVLHIHGKLCVRQRLILSNSVFANTIKWLYDDECLSIPNCR